MRGLRVEEREEKKRQGLHRVDPYQQSGRGLKVSNSRPQGVRALREEASGKSMGEEEAGKSSRRPHESKAEKQAGRQARMPNFV